VQLGSGIRYDWDKGKPEPSFSDDLRLDSGARKLTMQPLKYQRYQ